MVRSQIRLPEIATSHIHPCMKVIDVNPNYFRRRLNVYSISVVCCSPDTREYSDHVFSHVDIPTEIIPDGLRQNTKDYTVP